VAVITVKDKNAVLIPASVMRKARIKVGDRLDANVEHGKITLTPKSAVERGIEQGLDDPSAAGSTGHTLPQRPRRRPSTIERAR